MVGVVSLSEALQAAKNAGLDLVEVSPNAEPPVCKILDLGKYIYAKQKEAAAARKKQKVVQTKELKMRPTIEENDYQVKIRSARRFFEEGNKVRFVVVFRGREVAHQELGQTLMNRIKEELADVSKVDFAPQLEGKQISMVLSAK